MSYGPKNKHKSASASENYAIVPLPSGDIFRAP